MFVDDSKETLASFTKTLPRRALRRLVGAQGLMNPRFRVPALLVAIVMGLLTIERALILIAMPERFDGVAVGALLRGFVVSLRFDVVIACMLVLPILPAGFPLPRWMLSNRFFQWTVSVYGGFVTAVVFFACVADFFFFYEFGHRLDDKVLTYGGYDYVWKIIVDQYPLVSTLIAALMVFLIGIVVVRRLGFGSGRAENAPVDAIAWSVVIVFLVALGIRGSVGPKPINTGPAFFSASPSLCQLTLNGCFTLREAVATAVYRDVPPCRYYEVPPNDETLRIARKMVASARDQFVDTPANPLRRITRTGQPRRDINVVLVILESLSWHYVGGLGGEKELTPNLDDLAEHAILMDHCFAVGGRTTRGLCGVVSGFPDLPGESVTTRSNSEGNFLTIGSILAERGYQTMFVYGGQPYYDHRQSFLGSNGYNRFVFDDEFSSRTFKSHLGWCDGDLFRSAHDVFRSTRGPFFATLLTLSFHRPYQIPKGKIEPLPKDRPAAEQLNAIRYTDWALGQFMELARGAAYFDDTIFIFVADSPGGFRAPENSPEDFRIPFLIYAPKILGPEGKQISTVCSQTDVAPTILSLLGGSYEHCFFGSSILQKKPSNGYALIQPGHHALFSIDGERRALMMAPLSRNNHLFQFRAPDEMTAVDEPGLIRAAERTATGLLQAAYLLNRRGVYRLRWTERWRWTDSPHACASVNRELSTPSREKAPGRS